ncbi:MAG: PTS sugar transporter subunit IIC [Candidatus Krumholzibacteriota bacterium]|nr:PTS sugar transporter subunit IIC [Candidatus Krumholzibacteriota bacterium]
MNPFLTVSVLGGLLALDLRSSIRIMVSQPICGGLLTGLILGSPAEGFFAGALFQIIFLGHIDMRGNGILDLPVGGVTASALYILTLRRFSGDPSVNGFVLSCSILFGILAAGAGQAFYVWWEDASVVLVLRAVRYVKEGRYRLASAIHLSFLAIHFLYAFLFLIAAVPLGRFLISAAAFHLPGFLSGTLGQLYLLVPFIGIGSLLRLYTARSKVFWFASGFLLTTMALVVLG